MPDWGTVDDDSSCSCPDMENDDNGGVCSVGAGNWRCCSWC